MKKAIFLMISLFIIYLLTGNLDTSEVQSANYSSANGKVTNNQITNFELLVMSQLVYCSIDNIKTKKNLNLKELLISQDNSYLNATSKIKSELLGDGFDLKDLAKEAKLNQWHIYSYEKDEKNGFFGIIFKNEVTNKFVVSFEGTNSINALYEDYKIVTTDKENPQVKTARNLLDTLPKGINNKSITLTGHSLGGYIAALLGASLNYHAVVFNAFGFSSSYLKKLRAKGVLKDESNVINYHIKGDYISEYGEHIGEVVTFPKKWFWFFPQTHDINLFYSFIKA